MNRESLKKYMNKYFGESLKICLLTFFIELWGSKCYYELYQLCSLKGIKYYQEQNKFI